jgi:glycosyltransferase involved in cell wall biosynthesis
MDSAATLRSVRPALHATADEVLVAIPAHNEDRFIGSLVLKLRARGYSVLVVDDGSSDATASLAEAAGAIVVRHARNMGKTAAVHTAFQHARSLDVEALVLLDGDSQHEPGDVEQVAGPILSGQADMVVGSRYVGSGNDMPRWRVVGQQALTLATNIGSGLHLTDTQSGFRAFSRRAFEQISFRGQGFTIESEMQFQAKERGWKVLEVPIQVHYELPIKRNPVVQGMRTLDGIFRLIAEHRPLLFFTVPGLLMFLAGLGLGVQVVRIYEATLQLAVGYALITVLLCLGGMLSMFVGIMLHAMRGLLERAVGARSSPSE